MDSKLDDLWSRRSRTSRTPWRRRPEAERDPRRADEGRYLGGGRARRAGREGLGAGGGSLDLEAVDEQSSTRASAASTAYEELIEELRDAVDKLEGRRRDRPEAARAAQLARQPDRLRQLQQGGPDPGRHHYRDGLKTTVDRLDANDKMTRAQGGEDETTKTMSQRRRRVTKVAGERDIEAIKDR